MDKPRVSLIQRSASTAMVITNLFRRDPLIQTGDHQLTLFKNAQILMKE